MKISLIIPCYNEEKSLPTLFNNLQNLLNNNDVEIIIIENGSTDKSLSVITSFYEKNKNFKFVSLKKNKGYGYGILQGLKIANNEYLAWSHADLQTNPDDILEGMKLFDNSEKKIFVKGLRYGRKIEDRIFTVLMSIYASIKLGYLFWDINAVPSIFPVTFYEEWEDPPFDFSLELYAYFQAKKRGYKIKRIPVNFTKRLHGFSKWNFSLTSKIKFIKRSFKFIGELSKKYK